MSTALPAPMTYGVVKARFVQAVADSADADDLPDARALVGTVTFTPAASAILVASPEPTTILPAPIEVQLVNGAFEVKLIATDNAATQPTDWTYEVKFKFDGGASYKAFSLKVPANTVTDLTLVAPTPSSPGTVTVVNEQIRLDAIAAAERAEAAAARAEAAVGGTVPDDVVRTVNQMSGPNVVLDAWDVDAFPLPPDLTEPATRMPAISGDVVSFPVLADTALPSTVVQRTPGGQVDVAEPSSPEHAATKAYVDAVKDGAEVKRDPGTVGERAVGYSNGEPNVWIVTTGATTGAIARRSANGTLSVGTPTAESHATTKKYVDDAIAGVGTGGGTPPVTSVNQQTGAVVLDADDVGAIPSTYATPDGETRLPYYQASTGQLTHVVMSVAPGDGRVVRRQASGHVLVPTEPTTEQHAVSKKHLDDQLAAVPAPSTWDTLPGRPAVVAAGADVAAARAALGIYLLGPTDPDGTVAGGIYLRMP